MRRYSCLLVVLLAGCWSAGDRAPWNKPNSLLAHTGHPAWLDEAAKDARGDNMRMQNDVAKSEGSGSRSSSSNSSNSSNY